VLDDNPQAGCRDGSCCKGATPVLSKAMGVLTMWSPEASVALKRERRRLDHSFERGVAAFEARLELLVQCLVISW